MNLETDVAWSTLLFSAKWVIIGLVYLALLVVLIAVRREMRQRITGERLEPSATVGRLRVVRSGSDPTLRPGAVVGLVQETSLGADRSNDLVLADRYVSGRHARLRWDGSGWWLEDLGSKNGTFLDGRKCPPHQEQPVPFGATLVIGDVTFELVE